MVFSFRLSSLFLKEESVFNFFFFFSFFNYDVVWFIIYLFNYGIPLTAAMEMLPASLIPNLSFYLHWSSNPPDSNPYTTDFNLQKINRPSKIHIIYTQSNKTPSQNKTKRHNHKKSPKQTTQLTNPQQKDKEDLEEVSTELELADEDDLVP